MNYFTPEDIPMFQEFVGYLLLPTNKAQRMMIIKVACEGRSQIGTVLKKLFGINAKDGCIGKISENQFARTDLEHIHLLIDDDMRMEALKQNELCEIACHCERQDGFGEEGAAELSGAHVRPAARVQQWRLAIPV